MGVVLSGGRNVRTASAPYVQLRETVSLVTRQIEDMAWQNLSEDDRNMGLDDPYEQRRLQIRRNRIYRRKHPLAKQAFRLLAHYVLGQGVTLKANNKVQIAKVVDEFMDDTVNRKTFTSQQAMTEALDVIFTDADLFLILYPDKDAGTVQLGTIDSLLVEDIVYDPENWRIPLWYKVRKTTQKYDFDQGVWEPANSSEYVWFRDWHNDDTSNTNMSDAAKTMKPPPGKVEKGLVFHIARDKRGKFGESEMSAAIDWLKAHKDFMEDRATISRAAAQVAWRKKRNGPASDVAQQVQKLQSSLVGNIASWESNPPGASGQTVVENAGSTMEWVKTDTGGGNAQVDERLLRMMVGSALGVMNHYFGDEANANLATATAMELPMLKNYQAWQQLLQDVLTELIDFVLATAHEAGRIGPRDDSSKYSDAVSNPKGVLGTHSASADKAQLREAASEDGVEKAFTTPRVPNPETVQIAQDTEGALDWYVDIDFPPIVQKDLTSFVSAMKMMYELLPQSNLESQKFVAEMVLNELGVNDVQEVMDRLFDESTTAEMAQVKDLAMQRDQARTESQIAQAEAVKKTGGVPQVPMGRADREPVRESDVDEDDLEALTGHRAGRVLRVLRQTSDRLAEVAASS